MTKTPRVDEIALRHEGQALELNEAHAQYNDLLDLARQLEQELSVAASAAKCNYLLAEKYLKQSEALMDIQAEFDERMKRLHD